MVLFIKNMAERSQNPLPYIVQNDILNFEDKEKRQVTFRPDHDNLNQNEIMCQKKFLTKTIQNNFLNAYMYGNLDKYQIKKFLTTKISFTQLFYVLTNVGLLEYKESDQKRPTALYPTIDANVTRVSQPISGRENLISIKTLTFELILDTYNRENQGMWL